jgi:hypothetical protein
LRRRIDVTFAKGKTMKLAKSILYAAALGIAGSAVAQEPFADEEFSSDAARVYEIDEDRDGKADRLLILEDSDTLG